MKPSLVIVLFVLLFTSQAGDELPTILPVGEVGRYTLYSATVETHASGATLSQQELFRLDTTTGRTWRLYRHVTKTNYQEYWQGVREDSLTEYLHIYYLTNSPAYKKLIGKPSPATPDAPAPSTAPPWLTR